MLLYLISRVPGQEKAGRGRDASFIQNGSTEKRWKDNEEFLLVHYMEYKELSDANDEALGSVWQR